MDIYAQNILDRYKEPFYKDKKIRPDVCHAEKNHTCGDEVEVRLEIKNGKIKAYSFSGAGCAISQASADILGDMIIGKNPEEIMKMNQEELFSALGIEISPRRSKCALLGLITAQKAISHFIP